MRSIIKSITPDFLKRFYHKTGWFISNYKHIDQFSRLQSTHFHGPIVYDTDGLCTSNNADFINEPRFAKAYKAAAATNPWPGFTLQWRVYIVCWFADYVKNLDGDFVECGVNTGAYARAVIEYIHFNNLGKTFYLLDTFEGFANELVTQQELNSGIGKYFTAYGNVYEEVKKTFEQFKVKIIKGRVPDTLPECNAQKIAYLSIDMNAVAPEIAAINYFWDKVVPGGIIILDDYGFPQHIYQKKAFDQFALEKGISILSLPTAQGIIIKR